jgi:hypothetical protein
VDRIVSASLLVKCRGLDNRHWAGEDCGRLACVIFPSQILLWCLAGAIMAADCGLYLVYTQEGVGVVGIPVNNHEREGGDAVKNRFHLVSSRINNQGGVL